MSSKTERTILKSQTREIISKIYDFMKKEANNDYAEKLTDARWRTAQAVGVSERTVTRILRERKVHVMESSTNAKHTNNTNIEKNDQVTLSHSKGASTIK